jgi:hypothetical protein
VSLERWYYFLSIEKDFVRTLDFVHLCPPNFKSFSNEYAKLLLLAGREVDVVAKLLCDKVKPGAKAENIKDYRDIITAGFQGMHDVEIDIARYSMKLKPWASWDRSVAQSPAWWTAYNNVKHERDKNFPEANQENALNSVCGLLALLLYYLKDEGHLQPLSCWIMVFPSTSSQTLERSCRELDQSAVCHFVTIKTQRRQ